MWRLFGLILFFILFYGFVCNVWWRWGLNLGFHETQANTLPTELYPFHCFPLLLFKLICTII